MKRDLTALIRYVNSRVAVPHAWGRHRNDCISFMAGAVKAQTRRTHLGRLTWHDRATALRVLKRMGGMEAALDARFARIAPAAAMRGDIAGVPAELLHGGIKVSAFEMTGSEAQLIGIHPMLIEGATLCAPGPRGLMRLPRSAMVTAWSITDGPKADA